MLSINDSSPLFFIHTLRWICSTPPLVCPFSSSQSQPEQRHLAHFWPHAAQQLKTLQQHPEPLIQWMRKLRDQRLGAMFEHLLAFWLQQQPHLRLLAQNQPLREADRTLGAPDFIFQDLRDGNLWHWEVACKFYLQAETEPPGWIWLGPGKRDRLDAKLKHMRQHQLPLSKHPAFLHWLEQQGVQQPVQRLGIIWGRLFYAPQAPSGEEPLPLCEQHPRGQWFRHALPAGWQYCHKSALLAPEFVPDALEPADVTLPQPCCKVEKGQVRAWGFALPAGW